MAATEFVTENLIAGPIQTQQVKLVADTYYRGMPLEYDADNDRYQYLARGALAGFWLEEERTLTANEWGSIIVGGEILGRGIVTDADAEYTITEDLIAAWAVRGFYVKR
jgi:hypothetical protein